MNDPVVGKWETRYQRRPDEIHALVIIANDDTTKLEEARVKIELEVARFGGEILAGERGNQRTHKFDGKERDIEHFRMPKQT